MERFAQTSKTCLDAVSGLNASYNVAAHVLVLNQVGSATGGSREGSLLMKQCYVVLLFISLVSLAFAQNKNAQDPTLRPHHSNAIKPLVKGVPAHKASGDIAAHRTPIGNAELAPAKNGADAQVTTTERQQATAHNPKPAPKNAAPAAKPKKPTDANQPIDFKYKAPNARNTPVGGQANGRAAH
jgi:hypothetical protein